MICYNFEDLYVLAKLNVLFCASDGIHFRYLLFYFQGSYDGGLL
jgi:hypothetical protein